jgi:hypothetical protein
MLRASKEAVATNFEVIFTFLYGYYMPVIVAALSKA